MFAEHFGAGLINPPAVEWVQFFLTYRQFPYC